jgi:hypothetical protein
MNSAASWRHPVCGRNHWAWFSPRPLLYVPGSNLFCHCSLLSGCLFSSSEFYVPPGLVSVWRREAPHIKVSHDLNDIYSHHKWTLLTELLGHQQVRQRLKYSCKFLCCPEHCCSQVESVKSQFYRRNICSKVQSSRRVSHVPVIFSWYMTHKLICKYLDKYKFS